MRCNYGKSKFDIKKPLLSIELSCEAFTIIKNYITEFKELREYIKSGESRLTDTKKFFGNNW